MKRIIVGLISIFMTACGGSGGGSDSGAAVNTSLGEAQTLSDNYGKTMQEFQGVADLTDFEGPISSSDPMVSDLINGCSVVDSSSGNNIGIEITNGTGTCPISYLHQVNVSQQGSNSYSGSMSLNYRIVDSDLAATKELISHSCTANFNVTSNGSDSMNMSMSATCTSVTRSYGSFTANVQMSMSSAGSGSTKINSSGTITNDGKTFSFSIQFDSGSQSQPVVLVNGQDATGTGFNGGWAQSLMVF